MEIQVLSNDLEQTRKQVWKNDKKLKVLQQQKDGDDRSLQTQVLLRIWKPPAHKQSAVPKFSYFDKYVFIVRTLPMSKGNYMCALRSFFLVRFLQYPTPTNQSFTSSHHRRHCPRVFDHGKGRRFPHLRTPTPPRKGGSSSLSNHGWPAHHPTKPCPIRRLITSELRLRPRKAGFSPYLRAPTPPQKGRVFPLSNQRGTDITPRNPVQSGQRLPQRTDDPTPPGGGIRIAGLPLVFAGVGLELSEKKGVAIALGVRRWWSSLPCLKLVL